MVNLGKQGQRRDYELRLPHKPAKTQKGGEVRTAVTQGKTLFEIFYGDRLINVSIISLRLAALVLFKTSRGLWDHPAFKVAQGQTLFDGRLYMVAVQPTCNRILVVWDTEYETAT